MNSGAGKVAEVGSFLIGSREGKARTGVFHTKSGNFETPAFMPVGTQGTVKGVAPRELLEIGAQIVLANTYHLHLRPGDELIRDLGGIHSFCGWHGPILTDSGGYQVFSLAKLRKVNSEGVVFQSHIDGASVFFTPEKVVRIQENLDVDIMMVLDECLAADASRPVAEASLQLTLDWAKRSLDARIRPEVLTFGIVQGGMYADLRERACGELAQLGFDGYAIGGLSVGESVSVMREITEVSTACLPEDKIRYLMGVGTPLDIVESVALGVDMFDCVMSTRSARFGRLFVGDGWINIRNNCFRNDPLPIEPQCDCYACKNFSRAYISHLIHAKEILAVQLATLHNLRFYQRLMERVRTEISCGTLAEFVQSCREKWRETEDSRDSDPLARGELS